MDSRPLCSTPGAHTIQAERARAADSEEQEKDEVHKSFVAAIAQGQDTSRDGF
jgi:hypothetical protein